MTETQLQAKCFQWAYNAFPQIRGLLFSVPNGGTRNIIEAQQLKATGLTPGIPDMILLYNGCYGIEFKTEYGIVSPSQKKIHEIWRDNNIPVFIIKSENEFQNLINHIINK